MNTAHIQMNSVICSIQEVVGVLEMIDCLNLLTPRKPKLIYLQKTNIAFMLLSW